MESNQRYYARRAVEELRAAERAVTAEARARRRALAQTFLNKAEEYAAAEAALPRILSASLESAGY
ncbi:MAG: hypothetical protein QOJ94_1595 [Sphingomonadales bacterium]|jgi:hypothetical protein|nr:hypothetical protein [Sphingomonadales bacterium]